MLLSRREYAAHRGVSVSAVQKAIDEGRIVTTGGKIDPLTADQQWDENTNPAHRSTSSNSDSMKSYRNSRAMRETYEAALKKLEYEEKSGKLISAAQVEVEAFNASRLARDRLLRIPARIAPKLVGKRNIQEIERMLQNEIHESLIDLSNFFAGKQ